MGSYTPHTSADREAMLQDMGLTEVEQLFREIPAAVRLKRPLDLPPALSEPEVRRLVRTLAEVNASTDRYTCFIGAGFYDRYIPAAVPMLASRGEFLTAYTPYQPEIAQGTLQSIFEFQTLICELTGLDVANASMYDGASATAEAVLMALAHTGKKRVVVAETLHPEYRHVISTYLTALGAELQVVPYDAESGLVTAADATSVLDDETACLVVQYPNFFGGVEDLDLLIDAVHARRGLAIVVAEPVALGLLTPPGQLGADVVVGEGQSLGNALNFGGPAFGFFAAREAFTRRMPGRIVGLSQDRAGKRGFVLTLQTREQHIRRERATSNICTNNALNALQATIYLSLLGPQGLREAALQSAEKAHYAAQVLGRLPGHRIVFSGPFLQEFVLATPVAPRQIVAEAARHGVLAGLPLDHFFPELEHHLLIAVTEQRTRAEIDQLAHILGGLA